MKQILERSATAIQISTGNKINKFALLLHHLQILNTIKKKWQNLPIAKKLPQQGYRLVSLRPNTTGYTLTIFVANSAIESKFHNYLPSLLNQLTSFSITRINIKVRN